jgi:hypothetical protein
MQKKNTMGTENERYTTIPISVGSINYEALNPALMNTENKINTSLQHYVSSGNFM